MGLLRELGQAQDLDALSEKYQTQIEYALSQWSDAKDRWESGGLDDLEWIEED